MADSAAVVTGLLRAEKSVEQKQCTEATRYLAAAAHSDATFRKAILDNVRLSEFRCQAPEFGIDEQIIIEQCRIADRRARIREALLLATLLVFLLLSGFGADLAYFVQIDDIGALLQIHASGLIVLVIFGTAIVL